MLSGGGVIGNTGTGEFRGKTLGVSKIDMLSVDQAKSKQHEFTETGAIPGIHRAGQKN